MFIAQHEEVVVCLAGASTIGLTLTHECLLPANVRNIIFIDMKYLPPVTQQCIVVCYESVRFQVDNFIVGLECAQDTSS